MQFPNPYKALAGGVLDGLIHSRFFGECPGEPPAYSTDQAAAEKLRNRLKAVYRYPVRTGKTQMRRSAFYARLESGPSTSTEVLAETPSLAIARLALVLASKNNPATE